MKNTLMPHAPLAALLASRQPDGLRSAVRADGNDPSRVIGELSREVNRITGDVTQRLEQLETRQKDIEQSAGSRRGSGGGSASQSWGSQLENSTAAQSLNNSLRGTVAIRVENALTSASASGGALIAPDRRSDPIGLPRRKLTVRQLFAQGRTTSGLIEWPVQKTRVNNAAPVAETNAKPESQYTWEMKKFPVRTLAHWVPVPRQMMDDIPVLSSLIDGELRYGLDDVEDMELLKGDGTGEHLEGVMTTASPFVNPIPDFALTQKIDVLLAAIAQVDETNMPADGIVLHPLDWRGIQGLKDTTGRYLSEPFAELIERLFKMPIATSQAMDQGDFLVGSFLRGAEVFDRMETEVLISSEDRDNFIKNMLTVRAEERLAFVKKYPQAFVTGNFAEALAAVPAGNG